MVNMKKTAAKRFCKRLLTPVLCGFIAWSMTACSSESQRFKIDARFSQIDQGQFYIYSPDELIEGIDTVQLMRGRFTYSLNTKRPGILVVVFPNYSEQPIFVEPGKEVKVKGDVTHLKEMRVTGTDDNKLMNRLREVIATSSPLEMVAAARRFIEDHPQSIVGTYLVGRYFLQGDSVNYTEAKRLIDLMHDSQPDNGYLVRLDKQVSGLAASSVGQPLPAFAATTIDDKRIDSADLRTAKTVIVSPWVTWNFESVGQQRKLNREARKHRESLRVVSLCLDGSTSTCRLYADRDTLDAVLVVCSGEQLGDSLCRQLGIYGLDDNIVAKDGTITARRLPAEKLIETARYTE